MNKYEIILRGLPIPNRMMVGISISQQDFDKLRRNKRLIVDCLPPPTEPKDITPEEVSDAEGENKLKIPEELLKN